MGNFKSKLRKDLLDSRITKIVNNNIYFLHKDEGVKCDIYLEYEVLDKQYTDFVGNKANSVEHLIQVDIFSKSDYTNLEIIVEEVLKEKGYDFVTSADLYEKDTKLYHKAFRYIYKENKEAR